MKCRTHFLHRLAAERQPREAMRPMHKRGELSEYCSGERAGVVQRGNELEHVYACAFVGPAAVVDGRGSPHATDCSVVGDLESIERRPG
eukprot:6299459-Amphidinium_carterae.1